MAAGIADYGAVLASDVVVTVGNELRSDEPDTFVQVINVSVLLACSHARYLTYARDKSDNKVYLTLGTEYCGNSLLHGSTWDLSPLVRIE
jgi:hypothetical protein